MSTRNYKYYRGKGIGKLVMKTVIERLRYLGFKKIYNSAVYKWNIVTQKMHESLGFVVVDETEREYINELNL
ncbi:MAG TPA: GNAT family N-acetyltransferase [Acholeplasmataceae bacterium]|nr:GNAT family N-acetyltransferase [Acholeplasmataceae bacterium]